MKLLFDEDIGLINETTCAYCGWSVGHSWDCLSEDRESDKERQINMVKGLMERTFKDMAEAEDDICETTVDVQRSGLKETRIVDPKTGGEKGLKSDRYDLIPPEFIRALALHYGEGAKKYADRNWELGYAWNLSKRSVNSHMNAWELGERYDEETGTHHLIASIWHLVALYIFDTRGLGTDNITKLPDTPKE